MARRLFAAANHFDIASFGCSFASHRIFSFILFRSFALFSRSFFHRIVISFLSLCFAFNDFHRCIFRTHAALGAILAFQIFSVHFFFLHGSHAFQNRKSVYASRRPFYFPAFSQRGPHSEDNPQGQDQKVYRLRY